MEITPRGDRTGALAAFGVRTGPLAGEEVPIRSPVVRIGRGGDNDVVVTDDSVSTRHARLEFDEGAWRITDLDSTNGTYVEGVRLAPEVPTPLHYGSTVRLGAVELHFRPVEEADPAAARAEYAEPEAAPGIRQRRGARFPVWLLVALLLLVAIVVLLFFTLSPPDGPATVPVAEPPVAEQTVPAPAAPEP